MKIGIEVQIDVTKIEKARLYQGKKGKYLTMTTFIDTDNKDQYENNGFISHKASEEERAQKVNTPILGNCKVFYTDVEKTESAAAQAQYQGANANPQQPPAAMDDFDSDIPF